ncbi:hypothetical protein B0920_10400 [Massilia sp. KIM]|uniref:hypothetical protein n=1 Tax=Massilia sp. KIM TaxID=1955422 RepID=UPI00098F1CB1|nr:hypothetical protein [Massilia sp. KIM]OON63737.1 hypothetical protein B0920_10400 [Massilia sp. KIM]
MNATSLTPPDEMLAEVRAVHGWVRELVATPQTVRWHWPTFYLLYVDLDQLSGLLERIAGSLEAEPLALAGGDAQTLTQRERADWVEEACSPLGPALTSLIHRLWQVSRNTLCHLEDAALRERLRAHLQPKSEWYQSLRSDYATGRATPDGAVLERTVLVADPAPRGRIHDPGPLLRYQRFDIGTQGACAALAQAVRDVGAEQAEVWKSMKELLLAHCRIEDLIYPSSV